MRLHTISRLDLWLDVAARDRPDAAAVNGVSYAQLAAEAGALADALSDRIRPGDRIATTIAGPAFARLLHAVPILGAALVPLNTRLTQKERDAVLDSTQPALVLDSLP
jgi:acyl-CoA synthetase (AMP-forming)/AMP-acid ligase II